MAIQVYLLHRLLAFISRLILESAERQTRIPDS